MNALIVDYVCCWFFGVFVFLSFVGWGELIARGFFRNQLVGWGQKAAWGICLSIFIGGILNYFALVYKWVIWIYLAAGSLVLLWAVIDRKKQIAETISTFHQIRKGPLWILAAAVIGLCVFGYSRSVYTAPPGQFAAKEFNAQDDYLGYFVCIEKMTQTSTLTADPFNTRQLVSSLGGLYFLQAFVGFHFSQVFLGTMDQGIGLITVVLLLLETGRRKNVNSTVRLLMAGLFLITPFSIYIANITSFVLSLALFLAVYLVFESKSMQPGRLIPGAFVVALVVSSLCTLKSTNLVAAACFTAAAYLILLCRHRSHAKQVLCEAALAVLLTVLMMFPWMAFKYQTYGTFWYPIFGRGCCAYTGGDLYSSPAEILAPVMLLKTGVMVFNDVYVVAFLILGCFYFMRTKWFSSEGSFLKLFWISGVVGLMASVLIGSRAGIMRYAFPFIYAGIMLMLFEMAACLKRKEHSVQYLPFFAAVLLVAGMITADAVRDFSPLFYSTAYRIVNLFDGVDIASPKERDVYRDMQQSIPPAEAVLTRLNKPFLLDFQRNTVFVADCPGETSPPPGMPTGKGPQALADYLLSKSIRYVAYSYGNEAGYTRQGYGDRLKPNSPPWLQREAANTFDFQDNLKELMKTRKLIYDDGRNCVINLEQKAD